MMAPCTHGNTPFSLRVFFVLELPYCFFVFIIQSKLATVETSKIMDVKGLLKELLANEHTAIKPFTEQYLIPFPGTPAPLEVELIVCRTSKVFYFFLLFTASPEFTQSHTSCD